jgi:hypothetical protein
VRLCIVQVRLTTDELKRLDTLARKRGCTRSAVLRSVLEPADEGLPAPTRAWAIEQLQRHARAGSATAAAALARELRLGGELSVFKPGPINVDDLDPSELLQAVP